MATCKYGEEERKLEEGPAEDLKNRNSVSSRFKCADYRNFSQYKDLLHLSSSAAFAKVLLEFRSDADKLGRWPFPKVRPDRDIIDRLDVMVSTQRCELVPTEDFNPKTSRAAYPMLFKLNGLEHLILTTLAAATGVSHSELCRGLWQRFHRELSREGGWPPKERDVAADEAGRRAAAQALAQTRREQESRDERQEMLEHKRSW